MRNIGLNVYIIAEAHQMINSEPLTNFHDFASDVFTPSCETYRRIQAQLAMARIRDQKYGLVRVFIYTCQV